MSTPIPITKKNHPEDTKFTAVLQVIITNHSLKIHQKKEKSTSSFKKFMAIRLAKGSPLAIRTAIKNLASRFVLN
jgi:hypothetical protein